MMIPSRKPCQITVRFVGSPSDQAALAVARLLVGRESSRVPLELVHSENRVDCPDHDQSRPLPPVIEGSV